MLAVAQSLHRNLSYGASCLAGRARIDLAQSDHKVVGMVAKASGLMVPGPLLERADELIE
jgi:hypothetical protein